MIELVGKNFKTATINMFKDLKENMNSRKTNRECELKNRNYKKLPNRNFRTEKNTIQSEKSE